MHSKQRAGTPNSKHLRLARQATVFAAYSGANRMSADKEQSYSFTATTMLGWRPWAGGELYFNPEAAQGVLFEQTPWTVRLDGHLLMHS